MGFDNFNAWLYGILEKAHETWKSCLLSFFKGRMQSSAGILTVTDNRDGRVYNIPVLNNAVKATDLRVISTSRGLNPIARWESGLRVLDPGLVNTAVKTSQITYV